MTDIFIEYYRHIKIAFKLGVFCIYNLSYFISIFKGFNLIIFYFNYYFVQPATIKKKREFLNLKLKEVDKKGMKKA